MDAPILKRCGDCLFGYRDATHTAAKPSANHDSPAESHHIDQYWGKPLGRIWRASWNQRAEKLPHRSSAKSPRWGLIQILLAGLLDT